MIPDDLYYSEEHEWLRLEEDGTGTIGITHHAQEELGDIVYVELPEPDDEFAEDLEAGDSFGAVESVKAVSEVYLPVAGRVIAVNEALADAPEVVNEDPYGAGWLVRVRLDPEADPKSSLLSAAGYAAYLE